MADRRSPQATAGDWHRTSPSLKWLEPPGSTMIPVEAKGTDGLGDSREDGPAQGTGPGVPIDDRYPSLKSDITFEERPGGFEIWYSDRIATDYQELADQSVDWLEDQLGILNLGQVESRLLIADGRLTDEVKNGLVAWWAERVDDLQLE